MGGCVTIVLKEPSGETHKMLRWTNPLPHQLTDPRLYAEDPSPWVTDFMAPWLQMRNDYEAHPDGQYALPQTSVYFPWTAAAPAEYGIILIDLQSRQIHSMQNYCTEPYAIDLQLLHVYETNDPERAANIKGLLGCGAISKMHIKNGDAGEWKSFRSKDFESPRNLDQVWTNLIGLSRELSSTQALLEVSPSEFAIHGHKETLEGGLAFRKALAASGIVLDEDDDAHWRTWAEQRNGSDEIRKQFGIIPARNGCRP